MCVIVTQFVNIMHVRAGEPAGVHGHPIDLVEFGAVLRMQLVLGGG